MHDAVFLRNFDTLQPLRKSFRNILLNKSFPADAGRKTLHRHWTSSNVRQHQRRNHFVIRSEIALGDRVVGKKNLVGMTDYDVCAAADVKTLSVHSGPSNKLPLYSRFYTLALIVHSREPFERLATMKTNAAGVWL